MSFKTTTPRAIKAPGTQSRASTPKVRTIAIEENVYDKDTGEYYGTYIRTPYLPEPEPVSQHKATCLKNFWYIAEDGSPLPMESFPSTLAHTGKVIELFPQQTPEPKGNKSTAGRPPQVIANPLSTALATLKLEERPTPWLDDIVFGAINTGPGLVNGKHSVSLADVKRVLRLPAISVAGAASVLLNHQRQPMSTRQLQRVIEAARTALGGIALHLERQPNILRSIDIAIDFDEFWKSRDGQPKPATTKEHPMKHRALEMIRANAATKTIAKLLGISKNTVKSWTKEAGIGVVVEGSRTSD